MSERPKAYEGKENYIFISYAHSDRDRVYEVLYELENRGYRFWYDDGIAPGSEWAEDIAQHLNDAYLVIAFITKASVASDNCRREITYSLSKRKPFLSVILEDTEMSAGLELQLSAQQSVIRQNFRNWDGFINKILLSPDIAHCKAELPAAEPIPEEVKPAAVSAAIIPPETAAPVTEEVIQPEQAVPVTGTIVTDIPAGKEVIPAAAAEAATIETKAGPPEEGIKARRKGPSKKLLIFAAAAVLLLLGTIIANALTTVTTSWEKKYSTVDDRYVIADNKTITQEDIEKLCKMQSLTDIDFTKCDLSGCDLSVLTEQTKSKEGLQEIVLDDCTGIDDYSFLEGISWKKISLKNQSGFTDLSGIDLTALSDLNISGTGVSDISALSSAEYLTKLDISSTQTGDISSLSGLEKLSTVAARDTRVTSIDALSGISALHTIDFSGCSIGNIGSHFNSLEMNSINLAGCGIRDMSPFSDCTVLSDLNLTGNPDLEDMSWLNKQNYPGLQKVLLSKTGLDAEDLQFISSCPEITTLTLDGIQTDNLDFCKNSGQLEYISAQGCGLKDISGLKGKEKLVNIYLSFNEITDIGAFSSIDMNYSNPEMDLSFNKIESLSGLPKGRYDSLLIAGNKKDLASSLDGEFETGILVADWYDDITTAKFAESYSVYHKYLIGTPADQQLKIENTLNGGNLHFITLDELYGQLLPDNALEYSMSGDYKYASELYEAWKSSEESSE